MTKRSTGVALAVAFSGLAACAPNKPEAILVAVDVQAGAQTECVVLHFTSGERRAQSDGLVLDGGATDGGVKRLTYQIVRKSWPQTLIVEAVGYQRDCKTPVSPAERSGQKGVGFTANPVPTPALVLKAGERACADGVDDDGDGFTDCKDEDCDQQPCAETACFVQKRCDQRTCSGGVERTCTSAPTTCFEPVGACRGDGCQYTLKAACSDGDACTANDRCQLDGGCAGTRLDCRPLTTCRRFTGSCVDEQRCVFMDLPRGTPCDDGGVCGVGGSCLQPWPFQPSNVAQSAIGMPQPPVVLDCRGTIDTTALNDTWCPDAGAQLAVLQQPDGGEVAFAYVEGLDVRGGAQLEVRGARPLVLLVASHATIAGSFTLLNAPTSCTTGSGQAGSTRGGVDRSGGGGGGFGSSGGPGGGTSGLSGGSGGIVNGNDRLSPLRGGCPGGLGGASTATRALGGGALQLSVAGTLTFAGVISAPGEGGARVANLQGGSGAGSGGAILLEATSFTAPGGTLAANGGGGGCGGYFGGPAQVDDGASGGASTTSAAGSTCGIPFPKPLGGPGGAGSSTGGAGDWNGFAGGGGGGGVGRIRIRTQQGCAVGGMQASPRPVYDQVGQLGCPAP